MALGEEEKEEEVAQETYGEDIVIVNWLAESDWKEAKAPWESVEDLPITQFLPLIESLNIN